MSTDGQNVTKITKYITTTAGVLARVDSTNISEATYNEWGWKLEKDTEGNAILPKFGDFTWSGHLNREAIGTNAATAGKFDIDFEFGFVLMVLAIIIIQKKQILKFSIFLVNQRFSLVLIVNAQFNILNLQNLGAKV
jgi:hypothetical protein